MSAFSVIQSQTLNHWNTECNQWYMKCMKTERTVNTILWAKHQPNQSSIDSAIESHVSFGRTHSWRYCATGVWRHLVCGEREDWLWRTQWTQWVLCLCAKQWNQLSFTGSTVDPILCERHLRWPAVRHSATARPAPPATPTDVFSLTPGTSASPALSI